MKAELVNPFLGATSSVFQTMLGCELSRGEPSLKQSHSPEYEVSGLIGLTGKCQGMVVVSLGRDTAIKVAETMLGEAPPELNRDVIDAVGEVTNMIAGAAKAQLAQYQLSVGLPSVICGKNHSIGFPSNSTPISLPFESSIGPVCVEVGITEVDPAAV
ncbi:MAG: chemotaxis protein CheX [Pirellulales bacterium]|nr:chemotaxis protein CheX [Pirellulales bacterium]